MFMPPSVRAIAPAMHAIVSAPVTRVARYMPSHVAGSSASAGMASARTITTATHTAKASWARLKASLIGGSRRHAYAMAAPINAPARKSSPLANSRPKTNGMSASEKECALRRNLRCTTQASATAQPAAITHQGRCGSASGAVPCTEITNTAAAIAASIRPYSDTATSGVLLVPPFPRAAGSGEVLIRGCCPAGSSRATRVRTPRALYEGPVLRECPAIAFRGTSATRSSCSHHG